MRTFTYEEALKASLEYFDGDELAANVFLTKYALTDDNEQILESEPSKMHDRLAKEFHRIESKYPNPLSFDQIRESLDCFRYIVPQGSPMSAVGNNYHLQTVGNCYVIQGPKDSYGGILKTDQEEAQIAKRRGGIGFDISAIRPKGLPTKNAAKTTDGIGVFMERYSNTCREVAQNGRRGALLLTIDCHHPEIETFISIKRDLKKVTGANISIKWSDEFLNAVEREEKVQLRFPVNPGLKEYKMEKWVDAKLVWDKFVESAHFSAEPGCLFWDTTLRQSPADIYAEDGFRTISGNPCGEILMSEDSCRLLLLNLFSFVDNPFTGKATFNYDKFKHYVVMAQRMMDDLVDIELEKIEAILAKIEADPEDEDIKAVERNLWLRLKESCIKGRRTGLGLTAIADTIAALGIRFGSKKSITVVEEIYKTLAISAYKSSCILAKERGAFPVYSYKKEKDHPFIRQIMDADPEIEVLSQKYGRRNIAITTTAPCGSVSILTQTSSGIEPVFMLKYARRRKINPSDLNARVDFIDALGDKWQEYSVYHHAFQKWMDITGKNSVEDSPYYQATAAEIDWKAGVLLQAAAQKWVCHAISRTTNLPNEASVKDIHDVYWLGWKSGCKGMTVYRDGCRDGVLISESRTANDGVKNGRPMEIVPTHAPKRPEVLPCEIHHASIKGQKWIILVGLLMGKPYEMFAGEAEQLVLPPKLKTGIIAKVKQGHYNLHVGDGDEELVVKNIVKVFDNPESAWATRLVSMSLRHGVNVDFIVEQLSKDGNVADANKVLARVLKKYIPDGTIVQTNQSCPQCGSKDLRYEEGCVKCLACTFSKC